MISEPRTNDEILMAAAQCIHIIRGRFDRPLTDVDLDCLGKLFDGWLKSGRAISVYLFELGYSMSKAGTASLEEYFQQEKGQ